MRTAAWAPDDSTVYVGDTGNYPANWNHAFPLTGICDTVAAFSATQSPVSHRWVNYSGCDSYYSYSVAADTSAVYAAGHPRWADNANGCEHPGTGVVKDYGLYVLHQHAWLAVVRGDPARAAQFARAELDLADRRGYREFVGKGRIFTNWAWARLGVPDAAAEISSAVADAPRFGMPVLRHFWYRLEAEAKLAAGDREAALAAADEGPACSARTGECWTAPDLHILRATALGLLGHISAAAQAAGAGLAIAREMNQRPAERKAQAALDRLAVAAPS